MLCGTMGTMGYQWWLCCVRYIYYAGRQFCGEEPERLRGSLGKVQEQPRGTVAALQDDELQAHQQQGRETDHRTSGQLPEGQQEGGRQLRRYHVLRRRQDQGTRAETNLPHREGILRPQGILPGHQDRQPRRSDLRQQDQGHVQLIPYPPIPYHTHHQHRQH